ncbi:MAG: HAMP domain-containing sensor histidine kinase [Vicinamibacterales bacterium]
MLHEFLTTDRDAIIARARAKLTDRPWPMMATSELEFGVPLFLTQLAETLRLENTETPNGDAEINNCAMKHGAELRALGFNISQVVHDYGDICQAITELALERKTAVTTEEFHVLNRCLDTAIAGAVTEHARITAEQPSTGEIERSGQLAHEVRDQLNTALLAFHSLKGGTVAINGSTGAVLGRSLINLRDLVDSTLSDIRISANIARQERIPVNLFISEVAIAAKLHAEFRGLLLEVAEVDPQLAVNTDPQLLASALMNLLNNAFKFTHAGGHVSLQAVRDGDQVLIEVEDECGGMPDNSGDPFQPFTDRRKYDRSGLGLGLSIARKAVRTHGGDIRFRNVPGSGCIFTIELPMAAEISALYSLVPPGDASIQD